MFNATFNNISVISERLFLYTDSDYPFGILKIFL
jgi:hypothetical protein